MGNSIGLPVFFLVNSKFQTHYALFFSTKKRRARRKSIRPKLFLKVKIENFYLQNNFSPKKPFPHVF